MTLAHYPGQSVGGLARTLGLTHSGAVRLADRLPADIAALVRVDRILDHGNLHEPYVTWEGKYPGIPVASALQANVMADIRTGITGSLAETMRRVIEILPLPRSPDHKPPTAPSGS